MRCFDNTGGTGFFREWPPWTAIYKEHSDGYNEVRVFKKMKSFPQGNFHISHPLNSKILGTLLVLNNSISLLKIKNLGNGFSVLLQAVKGMWDCGVMEGGIFNVFLENEQWGLLTPLRLLQTAPRAAVWSGNPGTNQHQSGWQGWKRIDGKGWAGWWHLEDVTQWEGGEFGKQDKHRKVANSKQKCCWVERKRTMQKQGLKINKESKLS